MLKLKRWTRVEYGIGKDQISFEVKRPTFSEVQSFNSVFVRAWQEMQRVPPEEAAAIGVAKAELAAITDEVNADPAMPDAERSRKLSGPMGKLAELSMLAQARFFSALPEEFVARVFRDDVRNVQGLEDEDGKAIVTGEALYDLTDHDLTFFVLTHVRALASMNATEGKASGSPSTSATAPVEGNTPSGATSIEDEGGPKSSIATVSPVATP